MSSLKPHLVYGCIQISPASPNGKINKGFKNKEEMLKAY